MLPQKYDHSVIIIVDGWMLLLLLLKFGRRRACRAYLTWQHPHTHTHTRVFIIRHMTAI